MPRKSGLYCLCDTITENEWWCMEFRNLTGLYVVLAQWHNRRGGGGRQSAPCHFSLGNLCWPTGRKRKIEMEEVEMKNGRGKILKMTIGLFFFFACHFLKPLKFIWGLPEWAIFTRKRHISRQEKLGKVTLSPLENIPLTLLSLHHKRLFFLFCFVFF